jgi:hypothetical protein
VDFRGVTGRVRFDTVGDRRKGMAVMEVQPVPAGGYRTLLQGWVGER